MKAAVIVLAVLLCFGLPAGAQTVQLRFHDGLVTLRAQNASLRTILGEWARIGGTRVINAERLSASPLTLELNAVTEREAINVLLRNVAGYMAAPRAPSAGSTSYFDRILILPTSNPPRNPTPVAAPRPMTPRPLPPPVNPDDIAEESLEEEPEEAQSVSPLVRPRSLPPGTPAPQPNLEPEEDPQPAPAPTNPFGIPTSGMTDRPGVVVPAPQQPPQRTQPDPEP